jgi:carbonic anhydrase
MDRRSFLHGAVGAACVCGSCSGVGRALANDAPHWTYEGHGGPAEWGDLAPEYAVCGRGHEQSPVDLTQPIGAILPDPLISWRPVPLKVLNNGHTIQVDAADGGSMILDGVAYTLLQYHFHHPSEHTIEGVAFDMECHFVHKAADGGLAVLGLMITKGETNPALEAIWRLMPAMAGERAAADSPFDPLALLPASHITFRYAGSLTTPPCSEVVHWAVLRRPVTASAAQIERFASLFPNNARPVQPLNRRKLLLDVL